MAVERPPSAVGDQATEPPPGEDGEGRHRRDGMHQCEEEGS